MYSSYVELGKERQVFCLRHLIFQNCAHIYWQDRSSGVPPHRAAVGTGLGTNLGERDRTCIQVIENLEAQVWYLYNFSKTQKDIDILFEWHWMKRETRQPLSCFVIVTRTCAMMVKWLLQWFSLLNVRTIKSYHEVIEWAKPVSIYTFNISDERSTTMLDTIWSIYDGGVEKKEKMKTLTCKD